MSMEESINYKDLKKPEESIVYVLQEIPGTKVGMPKINIIGATQYGQLKVLLPENSQIILSPSYVISTLKTKLKDYKLKDFLLLTGDPLIIGIACSIVSGMTNGKYKSLKWDRQERRYYSVEVDIYNNS
jgi:hypothetical protein